MIFSINLFVSEKNGEEIIEFSKKYKLFEKRVPLVVVPSTFSHMTEQDLKNYGVRHIILSVFHKSEMIKRHYNNLYNGIILSHLLYVCP